MEFVRSMSKEMNGRFIAVSGPLRFFTYCFISVSSVRRVVGRGKDVERDRWLTCP